jgi:hypothetical protein
MISTKIKMWLTIALMYAIMVGSALAGGWGGW